MNKRRMRQGGLSLVITVVFIAAVMLFNIAAGLLADRFSLKIDMSAGGLYTLADEARTVLSEMEEDVTFTILAEEAVWNSALMIAEAVRGYESVSGGRIQIRYVDPDVNPWIIEQYPAEKAFNANGTIDIIVESTKRYTVVNSNELLRQELDSSTYTYVPTGLRVDQALVTALMYVLSDTVPKAVFVTNHGETVAVNMRTLFEELSVTCSELDLLTEEIPDGTTFLILASPTMDISEAEGRKLDNYKASGGNVWVLYDSTTPTLANVELFLGEWGMSFGKELIRHDTMSDATNPNYVYANISGDAAEVFPMLGEFTSYRTVGMNARPVYSLWTGNAKGSNHLIHPVVATDNEGYLVVDEVRAEGQTDAPYNMALLSRQYGYVDNEIVNSYVLAANASLFSDVILYGWEPNQYLLYALIDGMTPEAQSVYIPDKSLNTTALGMTAQDTQIVFIFLVVLVPLLILALGIYTWRRRKKL